MFQWLGKTVSGAWLWVFAAWVIAAGLLQWAAPQWDDVAQGGEFAFLPDESPSRRAEALFKHAFPDDIFSSSLVVLVHRDDRPDGLQDQDRKFISEVLKPRLQQIAEAEGGLAGTPRDDQAAAGAEKAPSGQRRHTSIIAAIQTFQDRGIGLLLESADGKASLVVVDLTTDFFDRRAFPTVDTIEAALTQLQSERRVPAGLQLSLTGSATLGRDLTRASLQSADAARFWTILLVVVLLALIYRAPFLALVPLFTLSISVEIAARILALLAQAGLIDVFQGLEVYITVIAYGAGVDYSVFLIARYRESLQQGDQIPVAIANAIARVGAAVTASAGTVICGIGMLAFAQFGKFHQAGIGISLSLCIVLCAVLTFTPALLRLGGHWAFWPALRPGPVPARDAASGTSTLRHWSAAHPLKNLGQRISVVVERRPGLIWLLSVGAMLPFAVIAVLHYYELSYGLIDQLPSSAPSVMGANALQQHFPAGITGPVTIVVTNNQVDFSDPDSIQQIQLLDKGLMARAEELKLADIRSVASPLGITAVNQMEKGLSASERLLERGAVRRRAIDFYVSGAPDLKLHATRLDLILDLDPFSRQSTADLERIEADVAADLPEELRRGSQLAYLGPTASIRDLQVVADHDRVLVNTLVLLTVFLILLALLQKVVVSLYLILSVVFSYLVALGATFAAFRLMQGPAFVGLDWTVPMFLFTLLVAVGEDYNIFLMTRIHEEQQQYDPVKGVTIALARTWGIITSCGIIMAGTFSSLTAGSLARMVQLGFALTVGVLLDTLVVRPILVPAFLILLENGTFGSIGKTFGARGRHARV